MDGQWGGPGGRGSRKGGPTYSNARWGDDNVPGQSAGPCSSGGGVKVNDHRNCQPGQHGAARWNQRNPDVAIPVDESWEEGASGTAVEGSLQNFFRFGNPRNPIPTLTAPNSATRLYMNSRPVSTGEDPFDVPFDREKDYVSRYRVVEQSKIDKICEDAPGRSGEPGENELVSEHSKLETSIMGAKGPIVSLNDPEVFDRYDMKSRKFKTDHLAIYGSKRAVLSALHTRQVVIVEGFTGCGKTTQVPQFLLDQAAEERRPCKIVVTQPRRIAAIAVAKRVCEERRWQLGDLVGYQVGMDRKCSDDTRLIYMTTGVLLQTLISKQNLYDWTHIIVDEVHERDLDTDLLLLVIKKLMVDQRDKTTRVILMSATLNATKFSDYFPSWGKSEANIPPLVTIKPVCSFKIVEHYIDGIAVQQGYHGFHMEPGEDPKLSEECYDMAVSIISSYDAHESNQRLELDSKTERGAVLVFLPGLLEIDTMFKKLNDFAKNLASGADGLDLTKWTVLPLHSTITSEEQHRVFLPVVPGYRKIILATNIAESSITVTDIVYVIDFCLTKSLSCDPNTNYTCLRLEWASKNQCIQRKGRAGRVADGHCYRMVTQKFYDSLEQEALPEMEKASLESVVLSVKVLNMDSPQGILALAIDPPKQSGIRRAVANLKEVGALTINIGHKYDAHDGDLTYLGRVMARLPIDIRLGRLILLGYVFGVLEEALIIAAGLSVKSPFSNPYLKRLEAYISKLSWSDKAYSDCFAILNLYRVWQDQHRAKKFGGFDGEKKWARSSFVQLSVMREMTAIITELKRRLKMSKIYAAPDDAILKPCSLEQGILLKVVIAGAFYPNYFLRSRPTKYDYEKEVTKEVIGKDPLHTVIFQGFPMEQPGTLYSRHIAAPFMFPNCIPTVNFYGSKVMLSFDPRGSKVGPISEGVYRAIKMRQLRQHISFKVLGREDSNAELNRATLEMERVAFVRSPINVTLPSIIENEIPVTIVHMVSPGEFWAIRQDNLEPRFYLMTKELQQQGNALRSLSYLRCEPGALCVVFEKGIFCRGRVECRRNYNEAMVYCIDTGQTVWKRLHEILEPNEELYRVDCHIIPAQAIQCRLAKIKASVRNGSVWHPSALSGMKNFIDSAGGDFTLKIFSIVEGLISGDIVTENPYRSGVDIALAEKWASPMEEPRSSMENNDARRSARVSNYNENMMRAYNEKQVSKKIPQRFIDPPLGDENCPTITLRGPHSPLELNFTALCRSSHLKQTIIEANSVNCVALDEEPYATTSRLLVSAGVGIAHRSGNLLARDTTMMPAIPGMVGLITMLFCPKMELRVDEHSTTYTGVLSGLGLDPATQMPVYPDHDVEVVFDTEFDNEDIRIINEIRIQMNMILAENRHQKLENLRQKIRANVNNLLERERKAIEELWPECIHKWSMPEECPAVLTDVSDDVECYRELTDICVFPVHTKYVLDKSGEPPNPSMNNHFRA